MRATGAEPAHGGGGRPRIVIGPSERLVIAAALVTASAYGLLGIPLRSPADIYLGILKGGVAWYLLGLVLSLLLLRLRAKNEARGATWRRFLNSYLQVPQLIADLRSVHVAVLIFFFFLQLKHLLPILGQVPFDGWFVDFEERIFGPGLASGFLQRAVPQIGAGTVSELYTLFYPYLGFILMVMVLQRDPLRRERFLLAFGLTWFGGLALVYLVPTLGPCFVRLESVLGISGTESRQLQEQLWQSYRYVASHPRSAQGIASISGFPSLHVAIVALGSFALGSFHRGLALASWILCVLTVFATIYLGWHYLLDDVAAIPLALLALRGAERIVR